MRERDEERERKRRREGERGWRLVPELSDYEQINPIEGTRAHLNMQQMSPSFLWMDGRKTVFRKQGIHQPRSKKKTSKQNLCIPIAPPHLDQYQTNRRFPFSKKHGAAGFLFPSVVFYTAQTHSIARCLTGASFHYSCQFSFP